jgi:cell division protein FtsB
MKNKFILSIILAVAGLIAVGFISYFAVKENKRNKQIEMEIEKLRQEAVKLRQNNQDMKEKIVYFETPEFQEKIAKEKLNLQKDNENVAIIKTAPILKEKDEEGKIEQSITYPEKPNYVKWWDYFFGYR